MSFKHLILLLLVPLSETKALFYNSNLKVDWYLFSKNKRYLCNVLEDYSNLLVFGIVFYYMAFVKLDVNIRKISLFLFILNAFDLIHLGLLDLSYFIPLKWFLTYITLRICTQLNRF